ncbi:unnamed protein product [Sympodiomycopsis kandeliae]
MGLAGTKRKQRLVGSAVTRNSSWLNDDSLPGQRLMAQMGWSQGQGIGLSSAGEARTENIKAMFKMDNKGIGAQRAEKEAREGAKHGVAGADNNKWIGGGGELGGLFDRLNASVSSTPQPQTPIEEAPQDEVGASSSSSKKRKRDSSDKKEKKEKESKSDKKERKDKKSKDKEKSKSESSSKSKSKKSKGKEKATDDSDKKKLKSRSKSKSKSHSSPSSSEAEVEESTTPLPLSSTSQAAAVIRNASRAKYLRAKRQLYGDATSMNEILGIKDSPSASAPASASASPAPVVMPTNVENAIAETILAQEQEEQSNEKQVKKAEKKAAKEAKKAEKKASKKEKEAKKAKAEEKPAEEKEEEVQNTISPYSVHEYLSRRLMLKKAQVMKQKRANDDVWGRMGGTGQGVGVMVES